MFLHMYTIRGMLRRPSAWVEQAYFSGELFSNTYCLQQVGDNAPHTHTHPSDRCCILGPDGIDHGYNTVQTSIAVLQKQRRFPPKIIACAVPSHLCLQA